MMVLSWNGTILMRRYQPLRILRLMDLHKDMRPAWEAFKMEKDRQCIKPGCWNYRWKPFRHCRSHVYLELPDDRRCEAYTLRASRCTNLKIAGQETCTIHAPQHRRQKKILRYLLEPKRCKTCHYWSKTGFIRCAVHPVSSDRHEDCPDYLAKGSNG